MATAAFVAAAVFAIAYDDGGYPIASRNTAAVVVWLALAVGVAAGILRLRRLTWWSRVAATSLTGLAAFAGLSSAWAPSSERALDDAARILVYVSVFLIVALTTTRSNVKHWLVGLAAAITAVMTVALVSRLFPSSLGGHTVITTSHETAKRLSFPLGYWNGLAVLAALGVPLLLGAALWLRRPLGRGLALAPLPVYAATIYLTSSRGGVLALLVATFVFFAVVPRRAAVVVELAVVVPAAAVVIAVLRNRPGVVNGPFSTTSAASEGRSAALWIAFACVTSGVVYGALVAAVPRIRVSRRVETALLVAAVAGIVAVVVASHPVARLHAFQRLPAQTRTNYVESHLLSPSGNGRWQLWQTAYHEFTTRPIVGRGAGSYELWQLQHGMLNTFVQDAHSAYLQTLGELGIVGLLLLAGVFAAGFGAAATGLRHADADTRIVMGAPVAVLAAFAVAIGFDWVWDLPGLAIVGIVALAQLTSAFGRRRSSVRDVTGGAAKGPAWPGRLAASLFIMLCCAAIMFEGLPLLSQLEIDASRSRAANGDLSGALRDGLRARSLTPWRATPYLQIALVAEQGNADAAARAWIAAATRHDPSDWSLWVTAARIDAESGRIDRARSDLARARFLNPGLQLVGGSSVAASTRRQGG